MSLSNASLSGVRVRASPLSHIVVCNLIALKLCVSLPPSYTINLSLSQQLFIHISRMGWGLWQLHLINAINKLYFEICDTI